MSSRSLTSSIRAVSALLVAGGALLAQGGRRPFGDPFEADFPFHGSTVDARRLGEAFPADNLTPRGLVLRAGARGFACFDTDLLRVAAVWLGKAGRSNGVTLDGMAPGSYQVAGRKAKQGQTALPRPLGRALCATGVYPGWQRGEFTRDDPRPPAPDPREVGRGPVAPGRFEAVEVRGGATVVYRLGGAVEVRESWSAQDGALVRRVALGPRQAAWLHAVADFGAGAPDVAPRRATVKVTGDEVRFALDGAPDVRFEAGPDGLLLLRVPAGAAVRFSLRIAAGSMAPEPGPDPKGPRWPQTVTTKLVRGVGAGAFAVDRVPLPVPNPWRRNVRAAGIDFLDARTAAVVTFDGDVWLAREREPGTFDWRRFAAGLHEPQALRVVDGAILVFTRTGILRLRDTDGDGACDRYETFCNAFSQTAETREFAQDMEVAPDGSLLIAKGGQQIGGAGLHGGTVLRVARDGSGFEVFARGLREPFVGVHPESGVVTASDQQGNWVPSTPVLMLREGDDLGFRDPDRFLTAGEDRNAAPAPSRPPLCWVPHEALKSASGQVWATGGGLGALEGRLLQLGYYPPSVFAVLGATPRGGAVVQVPVEFAFPPLDGRVHADGSLWLAGFRIWGTESQAVSGIARVRATGVAPAFPVAAAAYGQGVLLRFARKVDGAAAVAAGNYVVQRWQYRRTARYGSGHYRLDGAPGHDALRVTGVHLSGDGEAVFLRVDGMRKVMQMAVRYELPGCAGEVFLTVHAVAPAGLEGLGFTAPAVSAAPAAMAARQVPTGELGAKVFATVGCAACHSTDGTTVGKVGPSLQGVFGSERRLTEGKPVRVDVAYLKRAILAPHEQIVDGYQAVMPAYEGVLDDAQVESLLLFLKGLKR